MSIVLDIYLFVDHYPSRGNKNLLHSCIFLVKYYLTTSIPNKVKNVRVFSIILTVKFIPCSNL